MIVEMNKELRLEHAVCFHFTGTVASLKYSFEQLVASLGHGPMQSPECYISIHKGEFEDNYRADIYIDTSVVLPSLQKNDRLHDKKIAPASSKVNCRAGSKRHSTIK